VGALAPPRRRLHLLLLLLLTIPLRLLLLLHLTILLPFLRRLLLLLLPFRRRRLLLLLPYLRRRSRLLRRLASLASLPSQQQLVTQRPQQLVLLITPQRSRARRTSTGGSLVALLIPSLPSQQQQLVTLPSQPPQGSRVASRTSTGQPVTLQLVLQRTIQMGERTVGELRVHV
jgi:hypothetical protein